MFQEMPFYSTHCPLLGRQLIQASTFAADLAFCSRLGRWSARPTRRRNPRSVARARRVLRTGVAQENLQPHRVEPLLAHPVGLSLFPQLSQERPDRLPLPRRVLVLRSGVQVEAQPPPIMRPSILGNPFLCQRRIVASEKIRRDGKHRGTLPLRYIQPI